MHRHRRLYEERYCGEMKKREVCFVYGGCSYSLRLQEESQQAALKQLIQDVAVAKEKKILKFLI